MSLLPRGSAAADTAAVATHSRRIVQGKCKLHAQKQVSGFRCQVSGEIRYQKDDLSRNRSAQCQLIRPRNRQVVWRKKLRCLVDSGAQSLG